MEAKLDMVLEQVGRDKNIDKSVLLSALEQAILTAAKRTFGMNREMEAKFNPETGSVDLFLIVNVVEEDDAIEVDGEVFHLPIDDIDTARLVPDWDAVMKGGSGVGPRQNKPIKPGHRPSQKTKNKHSAGSNNPKNSMKEQG